MQIKDKCHLSCHQGNGLCCGGALKPTRVRIASGVKTINIAYVWHKTYIILDGNVSTFVIFYHPLLWLSRLFVDFLFQHFSLAYYFFWTWFCHFVEHWLVVSSISIQLWLTQGKLQGLFGDACAVSMFIIQIRYYLWVVMGYCK